MPFEISDITLSKVGEDKPKVSLPRGVHIVQLGDRIVFVRWFRLRKIMMPLPQDEQERLAKKLGWTND